MKRIAALAVALFVTGVCAQTYPNKPIRIVVPYAAGGTSDILARQIGPKLTDAWGQPVIVENKPGANGNVGADFVAKSAPDGYTLLLTDLGGLVISASVYPKLPFNPSKDFTPGRDGVVLAACAGRASGRASEEREGARRHGEGVSRQAQFRDFRHRRGAAARRHRVRAAHGHRLDLHPVQGRGGRHHRRCRRPGARAFQRHARHLAPCHGRQAAGAGDLQRQARAERTRYADGRRAGACRLRDRLLPGRDRAGRHSARDRDQAERRADQGAQHRGDEGALRETGHRGTHRHVREPRQVDGHRAGASGQRW